MQRGAERRDVRTARSGFGVPEQRREEARDGMGEDSDGDSRHDSQYHDPGWVSLLPAAKREGTTDDQERRRHEPSRDEDIELFVTRLRGGQGAVGSMPTVSITARR